MPELVRMYIRNVAIGFALAIVFVALLLWGNIGNLRHLIFATSGGWLALFLLVFFNGLVFAGAQFAIAVMGMAEKPGPSGGATRPAVSMAWFLAPRPARIPEAERN